MQLSRKKIQRMVGTRASSSGGSSSGYGYATETWVNDTFISKAFFANLFKAYDANDEEITPNDDETTVDNIEALVDFWSDGGISALGQGSGGGSGTSTTLAGLLDVALSSPASGEALVYDGTKWVNAAIQTGGATIADVWTALATDDPTNQIDASHLSAVTGTIWGQTFDLDSHNTVTGAMTGVTNINSLIYLTAQTGRVGIGASSPTYTLDVAGTIRVGSYSNLLGVSSSSIEIGSYTNEIMISGSHSTMQVNFRASGLSKTIPTDWTWYAGNSGSYANFTLGDLYARGSIRIGNAILSWDSTNKALKVSHATTGEVCNLYATGGVSALGYSS